MATHSWPQCPFIRMVSQMTYYKLPAALANCMLLAHSTYMESSVGGNNSAHGTSYEAKEVLGHPHIYIYTSH